MRNLKFSQYEILTTQILLALGLMSYIEDAHSKQIYLPEKTTKGLKKICDKVLALIEAEGGE